MKVFAEAVFSYLKLLYKRNYVYIKGEDLGTMSTRRVWKQVKLKQTHYFLRCAVLLKLHFMETM